MSDKDAHSFRTLEENFGGGTPEALLKESLDLIRQQREELAELRAKRMAYVRSCPSSTRNYCKLLCVFSFIAEGKRQSHRCARGKCA